MKKEQILSEMREDSDYLKILSRKTLEIIRITNFIRIRRRSCLTEVCSMPSKLASSTANYIFYIKLNGHAYSYLLLLFGASCFFSKNHLKKRLILL